MTVTAKEKLKNNTLYNVENKLLGHYIKNQIIANKAFYSKLVEKYNSSHKEPLPTVTTPHTLRHTFCTNMANAGMNSKALQYLMGHANITMTLNYYAHATFDSAQAEFFRLAA